MFYDLNVPWSANDTEFSRKLNFLSELGYNVVALNHNIQGKLPNELTCAIPNPLPVADLPPKLEIRRRVTLTLTDTLQNARLNQLGNCYDILALRPVDEKTLQLACGSYDCDIISLDLTQRFPFHFKFKMLSEAIKSGKRIEISYSQGLLGDNQSRRNLISNATQLIRATRGGRGLLITSEARAAVGLRGPWDAINLATIWGLGQERGYEAMSKDARTVVVSAQLKRTSFRGVIDVIYGGEKPVRDTTAGGVQKKGSGKHAIDDRKRKSDTLGTDDIASTEAVEKPLSNTQKKKRAKLARLEAEKGMKKAEPNSAK